MKKTNSYRAFSLIEISIVILIIGVIVAGAVQGSRMIKKAKLTSARATTNSAPVNFVKDLSGWYDTVSESSFSATQADDGKSVSVWSSIAKTDSSSVASAGTQGTPTNQPTYVDGSINSLPTLSFDGGDAIKLQDGSFPTGNSPYTVFIVANPSSSGTVLTSGSGSNINSMGFDSSGNFVVDGGTGNGGTFSTATAGSNNLQIITHSYNGTTPTLSNNKVWINGTSSTINSVSGAGIAKTTGSNLIAIGATSSGFIGKLGEIIIFNRALDNDERQDIEKYLAKKWGPKLGGAISGSGGPSGCSAATVTNAIVAGYSNALSGGTYASGTTATATCNSGYLASSTSATANITCTNGSWSSATCSQACGNPTSVVAGGTVTASGSVGGYYYTGTSGTLTCSSGSPIGSSSGSCSGGTWTGFGTCDQSCQSITDPVACSNNSACEWINGVCNTKPTTAPCDAQDETECTSAPSCQWIGICIPS